VTNKPTGRIQDADPHSEGIENARRAAKTLLGSLKKKDDVTEGRRKL
jgi:hypothetical protein